MTEAETPRCIEPGSIRIAIYRPEQGASDCGTYVCPEHANAVEAAIEAAGAAAHWTLGVDGPERCGDTVRSAAATR